MPSSPSTRTAVVLSFWAVLLLGVPIWWKTTAIERLALPTADIEALPVYTSTPLDSRAAKYAPAYKVVFSLLNEDATLPGALLSWPIHDLVNEHISPTLDALSALHNFTVETEIQYFAPMAVELFPGGESEADGREVREDDLKAFVNTDEWRMATSMTPEPVLHFILYVPAPKHRPLRIRLQSGSLAPISAFLTPQRGGVVIHNPTSPLSLSNSFAPFRAQLTILLGLTQDVPLPELVRRRTQETREDAAATLKATAKLAGEIQNMRIGVEVQTDVRAALEELKKSEEDGVGAQGAFVHAAAARELASRAYYNPSMLGLLYFPDEHKYAVYTPLFGPIAIPLIVALLNEVKGWRQRRKEKVQ